jgi:diacylglycerol O-acyltransferase / wax synthase
VFDEQFSVARHVSELDLWQYYKANIDHDVQLPSPITKDVEAKALRKVLAHLASFQLPTDRALWHTHMIHLQFTHGPRGGSELRASTLMVSRIHHTIGDGLSLMRYTLSTCKPYVERDEARSSSSSPTTPTTPTPPPPKAKGIALHVILMTVIMAPFTGLRLLLQRPDKHTFLRNKTHHLQYSRTTTWVCPSFDLQRIKSIASSHKATVNDVMVAIVSRAIHLHAEAVSGKPGTMPSVKAFVPVGSTFSADDNELQNNFGFLFLQMPCDATSIGSCLQRVKREMDALKRSPLPMLTYLSSAVSGYILAPFWLVLNTMYFTSLASIVFSNVKGPDTPLDLAGYKVEDMCFLVPQAGNIGVGISILSYDGQVSIGILANTSVFPIDGQEEAFTRKCQLAFQEFSS